MLEIYFPESITLDLTSYSAVACWVRTLSVSQTNLSQAYKFCYQERCRVQQYVELKFHQPKPEVSKIVALCQNARTAAQTLHRLWLLQVKETIFYQSKIPNIQYRSNATLHSRTGVHLLMLAQSLIKGVWHHFVSKYSPCQKQGEYL